MIFLSIFQYLILFLYFIILLMSDKLSSPEEYVEKKLRPIFNAMTQYVIKEGGDDPVSSINFFNRF